MTTKYHVNPETGNPGVCVATRSCRYGKTTPHYESPSDARAAYAFSYESLGFTVQRKRPERGLSPAIKIEATRLGALLNADFPANEAQQIKIDASVELRITRLGEFLADEADKRAGFNRSDFQKSLEELSEAEREQAVDAMTRKIVAANIAVLGELRELGGALGYRVPEDESSTNATLVLEDTVEKLYPKAWLEASNKTSDSFKIVGIDNERASYGHRVAQPQLSCSEHPDHSIVEPKYFYYIPVKAEDAERALELLGEEAKLVDAPGYLERDGERRVIQMPLAEIADEETPMEENPSRGGDEPSSRPTGEGWRWGHYIDGDTDTVSDEKGWSKAIENHEMVYLSALRITNPTRDEATGELTPITDRQRRTSLHEFAHRTERTVPGIMRMEHAFLNRRTADEDGNVNTLDYIYPPRPTDSFMSSERGRFGNFVTSYIGKEYVDSPAREVFSVGVEAVLGGTYEGLSGVSSDKNLDRDMRGFVMGLLASA